jgi:hypothetical protein
MVSATWRTESARLRYRLLTAVGFREHNLDVSRTRKDSGQISNTVLELVMKVEGSFDLFLNGKLDRTSIPKRWLNEELCVRFGFCGEEYDAIVLETTTKGRATRVL